MPAPPPAALADTEALLAAWDQPERSVRANLVVSADGAAARQGSAVALSSPADRYAFHLLRALPDVVLVGAQTVRRDDYGPVRVRPERRAWRTGRGRAERPRLAVVSRGLDLGPDPRWLAGPVPPLVLTCAGAPAARREALSEHAEVVVAGEDAVDLAAALAALRARGLGRVLCEGGPRLLTGLVAAGLLDELCLTVAPLLVGDGPRLLVEGLPTPVGLRLQHALPVEDDVLLRYRVDRPAAQPPGASLAR